MLNSPFEGMGALPRDLVCDFFAFFARLEYALKARGYGRAHRGTDHASPNWRAFAADAAGWLTFPPDEDLDRAIDYLVENPPQVQRWPGLHWSPEPLRGQHRIEQAIDAACRVRNNLFHGGKHTPHSEPERDVHLIYSALCLLQACIEQEPGDLRGIFENT